MDRTHQLRQSTVLLLNERSGKSRESVASEILSLPFEGFSIVASRVGCLRANPSFWYVNVTVGSTHLV
jgi:hypothetical protein